MPIPSPEGDRLIAQVFEDNPYALPTVVALVICGFVFFGILIVKNKKHEDDDNW